MDELSFGSGPAPVVAAHVALGVLGVMVLAPALAARDQAAALRESGS